MDGETLNETVDAELTELPADLLPDWSAFRS